VWKGKRKSEVRAKDGGAERIAGLGNKRKKKGIDLKAAVPLQGKGQLVEDEAESSKELSCTTYVERSRQPERCERTINWVETGVQWQSHLKGEESVDGLKERSGV